MNLTVKGRNLVLTDTISSYAEEKLGRLSKYLVSSSRCEVELWTEKNPSIADNQVVEVTIFTKGPVIRAREASPDIYASIDLVFEKLERQVKKYRGKLMSHGQGTPKETLVSEGFKLLEEHEEPEEEAPTPRIVKTHGTKHQKGLSKVGRQSNLREAFELRAGAAARLGAESAGIVLIDDVYTTGATAGEVSSVLAAGTNLPVYVFTFSRAVVSGAERHD